MTLSEQHLAMSYLIDEHADHLRARCSDTTIEARSRILRRLHEYLPHGLAYAYAVQIEAFYAQGHRLGWKRWTLRNYDTHFRGFYAWADEAGKLDGNVMLRVRRPKPGRFRPKPLSSAQVLRALTAPEPWRTVFALAYYEGMRAAEIAACCGEDITEEITFIPRGKGGTAGEVPTHPVVWALVQGRGPGPLFPCGVRGGRVDGHAISQGARREFARLGLPGAHVHQLRHSHATAQMRAGTNLRIIQENMRHRNLATLTVYTEVTLEERRAAILALPVVAGTPAGCKPAGAAQSDSPA